MIQKRREKSRPQAQRNRVRIIGGTWRSRLIEFPDAPGLRPTADRIRETLFNWLGQTLHGKRCLDLFAGSGALGFEAASRGAAEVVMVESQRAALESLKTNVLRLQATHVAVRYADARDYLAGCSERFDIVFVDPPFQSGMLPAIVASVAAVVADEGLVYVESGEPFTALAPGWDITRQGRAGAVHFGLLQRKEDQA